MNISLINFSHPKLLTSDNIWHCIHLLHAASKTDSFAARFSAIFSFLIFGFAETSPRTPQKAELLI